MAAQVNPDLQVERDGATFDPEKLTYELWWGEESTKKRRAVEKQALADLQTLDVPEYYFQSRPEKYSESMKRSVFYMKKYQKGDFKTKDEAAWYRSQFFPNENPPMALQDAMFIPTMQDQTTPEQKQRWLQDAKNYRILGTYAQTELGHGTHVRGLETTATYDPSTEEFVIHSPTLTSTKWWPGSLGKTTNHAVVMAMLYTKGVNQGVHPFLVQTRSMKDHKPLPGIEIGDIGPKFGYDTIDNGFLRLDHVRIPRENMLMKYARVEKDGTFVRQAKNARLNYGVMVQVRAGICFGVGTRGLAQCCTIAVRYSCVRRQSELKPGGEEPKVLEFQTQQQKLLPWVAAAYAYWFAGQSVLNTHSMVTQEIEKGNVDLLPELHALSAGLKSYTTYGANIGMEVCRLACGGHGYSHASGFPKIYTHNTPGCTYEGENTVLYLQTARYLLKNYMAAQQGKKISGTVAYISDPDTDRCEITKDMSLASICSTFKHRARRLVAEAAGRTAKLRAGGKPQWEAWNLSTVHWIKAAEAHCEYFVVSTFADKVTSVQDPAVRRVLIQLFQLFATNAVIKNGADFILDAYMSNNQLEMITEHSLSLLADIRPNAVALVDAFDFTDRGLCSVLGRYDGNVYENLYKWATQAPLNKTDVHESYNKYLRPLMLESQSKL